MMIKDTKFMLSVNAKTFTKHDSTRLLYTRKKFRSKLTSESSVNTLGVFKDYELA